MQTFPARQKEKRGEEEETAEMDQQKKKELLESGVPKFRVTCNRSGDKHSFGSPDVAANVGGEVQECFGWAVSMKEFDVEVVVHIQDNHVSSFLLRI
ncbi:MAG: hypothetical protein GY799_19960 [Desulfobulbaceae bacterium]|nr:hypothetical protein [Desulfobulbaceae bacterium]